MKRTFIREDALDEEVEVVLTDTRPNVMSESKESTVLPSNNYFG